MATKPKPPTLARWRIYLLREKAEYVDTVEALDAKAAIHVAIHVFGITDPIHHQRLSVQPDE